ncbi:MAG: hypothetical protein ACT4N5_07005 [Nitrosopumilaceae archaeon]
MQLEEANDLLRMLVNLNDKAPLQYKSSHREEYPHQENYKTLELLEYLTEIKMGVEVVKASAKGRVDKKIQRQFMRIDKAISSMTDKILESKPSN